MADRTELAIAAQGAGPLTPLQIRALAVEARRAWEAQRRLGLAEEDFETWRHGAVQDAAPGRRGLRDLTQRDFAPVRAWLRELSGGAQPGSPNWSSARDDARRARWRLRRCMEAVAGFYGGRDGVERYVAELFRSIHRTSPEEATARQVWQVLFTLRDRTAARAGNRWASRTPPRKAAERAGRGGRPENGQGAVPGAPRVFPRLSRVGIGV